MEIENRPSGVTPAQSNNFMLILIVATISIQLILGVALQVAQIVDPSFQLDIPFWALVLISQGLTFGVPCAIYLLIKRRHIKEILPLRGLGWANVVMIVALSIFIQPLFMMINVVSQFIFPNVIGDVIEGVNQEGGWLLSIAIIAVVPSIFEEVAFRGIGFAGYKSVKIAGAAAINGLVFGMIHMNMNQFLYAFLLGAVFCYFMYYTKSLWAPVLAHFVINGSQATLMHIFTSIDVEALEAAAEADMAQLGGLETLLAVVIMGFVALMFTGLFIAVYIPFKRHNIKRNEAAGIITDTAAAAREAGEVPPKAFTWAIGTIIIIFGLIAALNYLLPVLLQYMPEYQLL